MRGGEAARRELEEIVRTGELQGVRLELYRGHDNMPGWGPPLSQGWFGIPGSTTKYQVEPVTVGVDSFLRLQMHILDQPWQAFVEGAYQPTVQMARETLELGNGAVPAPVIEVDVDGSVVQEGRSRALGAKRAGEDLMPAWLAVKAYS
jgi:hypothetical protein